MSDNILSWGTPEWFQFIKDNKIAFDALDANEFTSDGLIECRNLDIESTNNSYNLWLQKDKRISVCATKYASPIVDYLVSKQCLWSSAAIRIVHGRGTYSRALMFGVSFQRAVEIALSKGFIMSEFYLPHQSDDVWYATLLLHVSRRKESNGSVIELQAWQYCPGTPEVFYIHSESQDFSTHVTHLDGAIIYFDPEQVRQLFIICNKIKDDSYEKQFRLDGSISVIDMYNIISLYLPVTELVGEAFQCREKHA